MYYLCYHSYFFFFSHMVFAKILSFLCVCFPLIRPQTLPQLCGFPLKLLRLKQFSSFWRQSPRAPAMFQKGLFEIHFFYICPQIFLHQNPLPLQSLVCVPLFCCCYYMILRWHPNTECTCIFLLGTEGKVGYYFSWEYEIHYSIIFLLVLLLLRNLKSSSTWVA